MANTFTTTPLKFIAPLANKINFCSMYKVLPTKGNIVYEYNPFRNYRLDKDMYEYKGHMYTEDELKKLGITITTNADNK